MTDIANPYADRQYNINALIDLLQDLRGHATDEQLDAIHAQMLLTVVQIIGFDRPNMTDQQLDALWARAWKLHAR